jgi:predicted dehydrogenase
VALGEKAKVVATVGFSFRFNPAIQALRRDLLDGRLGEIWLIELAEHNPQFHPDGGKPLNWKGDPAHAGGGALFEYGSHVIDLALWLVGPIARVSSSLKKVLPAARLDDIATLQMEFANGATGLLVSSWVLSGGFPGIGIRVHGSKGLAEVWVDDRLEGGQRYRITPVFGRVEKDRQLPSMHELRSDAARRHIGDFLAAVRGMPPQHGDTLPTLRQAAYVQDVLAAALSASDVWQAVKRSNQSVREEWINDHGKRKTPN